MAVSVTVPASTTKLIALADLKAILGITDGTNDALLGHISQRGSDTYTLTEPEAGIVFRETYRAYTGHQYSYPLAMRTATTCRPRRAPTPCPTTFSRPRWSCARACGLPGSAPLP
jgi:hypothetical protein